MQRRQLGSPGFSPLSLRMSELLLRHVTAIEHYGMAFVSTASYDFAHGQRLQSSRRLQADVSY